MFVKICGITLKEEVDYCIEAGAHAFGFIVGATHETPDEISPEQAQILSLYGKEKISPVMVTHLTNLSEIVRLYRSIKPWGIQLQADMSLEDVYLTKRICHAAKIIKAIHVNGQESIDRAKDFMYMVDFILLDSRTETKLGGTGIIHDWDISKKIVENVKVPVILAGGLTPENGKSAIQKVHPFGVDVNTGTKGLDGRKSKTKIQEFVLNAKGTNPWFSSHRCIYGHRQ